MPATIPTAIHATWTIDDRSAARGGYDFADPRDALTVSASGAPYECADTPATFVAERGGSAAQAPRQP